MRRMFSASSKRGHFPFIARSCFAVLVAAALSISVTGSDTGTANPPRAVQAVANASDSGWSPAGSDTFAFNTADGRATAVGVVKWYHGGFPRGYLHRGEYTALPSVVATRPVGCLWASTQWGYPLGSLSIPPAFSVSGAATRGKWLVSCRSRGAKLPPFINLQGLSYAKALLNSTTLTICVSATKADGPRECSNHKMHY